MLRRSLFAIFLLALPGVLLFGSPAARTSARFAPSQKLRVMTYNIHVGVGMDKKLDLARIAGVINSEHPDLVGLQEVDRGVTRTQRIDEIAELAKLTRMDYAFAFNLHYQGGQYGVAILSRFPIRATDHRLYQNRREAERRGGGEGDNLSAIVVRWGPETLIDEPSTTITETLGLGEFATQLDRTLSLTDRKTSDPDLSDDEIERAIDEIQTTIHRYRR